MSGIESSLKRTVKGSTIVILGTAVSSLAWFAAKVLITRQLTKEDLGIYSLAITVVSVAAVFASAGLHTSATRFISMFLSEGKNKDAEDVARASIRIGMLTGFVASVALYFLSPSIARHAFYIPELVEPLRVISASIFFSVMSLIITSIMNGYGFVQPRVYYSLVGQPVFFLLALGVVLLMGFSLPGVIYSYVFSIIAVYACVAVYGYRKARVEPFAMKKSGFKKKLLLFSIPLLGMSVLGMIFIWTDTILLGRYAGAETVGVYTVSSTLSNLLSFTYSASGFVFMPIAGELFAKQQMAELKRVYQVITKWVFFSTIPIFFALVAFPEVIVSLFFGDGFAGSVAPLRVLSAGLMCNVFFGANGMLVIVMGMTRASLIITAVATVVNAALNYVFVKLIGLGAPGAALATVISIIYINIAMSIVLYARSRLHLFTTMYIKPIVGAAVAGFATYALSKSLPFSPWMLPAYFTLFMCGFIISLLLTRSIDKEDIFLLDAVSKKTGLELATAKKLVRYFAKQ